MNEQINLKVLEENQFYFSLDVQQFMEDTTYKNRPNYFQQTKIKAPCHREKCRNSTKSRQNTLIFCTNLSKICTNLKLSFGTTSSKIVQSYSKLRFKLRKIQAFLNKFSEVSVGRRRVQATFRFLGQLQAIFVNFYYFCLLLTFSPVTT